MKTDYSTDRTGNEISIEQEIGRLPQLLQAGAIDTNEAFAVHYNLTTERDSGRNLD